MPAAGPQSVGSRGVCATPIAGPLCHRGRCVSCRGVGATPIAGPLCHRGRCVSCQGVRATTITGPLCHVGSRGSYVQVIIITDYAWLGNTKNCSYRINGAHSYPKLNRSLCTCHAHVKHLEKHKKSIVYMLVHTTSLVHTFWFVLCFGCRACSLTRFVFAFAVGLALSLFPCVLYTNRHI